MNKAALFIIDMQNKWIGTDITLFPPPHEVISAINQLRMEWRRLGQPVFFVTLVHNPDGSTLSKFDSKAWNVRGSDEAKIVSDLTPVGGERLIEKTRYSAFFETGLAEILKNEKIEKCVITGYQARACVLATALDAYQHDIKSIVVSDAICDTDEEYLNFYLKVFTDADLLMTSEDVIRELSAATS